MNIDMTHLRMPASQLVFVTAVDRDDRGPVVAIAGPPGSRAGARFFRPTGPTRLVPGAIVQVAIEQQAGIVTLVGIGAGTERWHHSPSRPSDAR